MNSGRPGVPSSRFASELVFGWSTLTAGAMFFAILATLLSTMDFSETVSFFVPFLLTLALVVALHLNRLAEQWPRAGRAPALTGSILGRSVIRTTKRPSEEEFVELLVKFYQKAPPEQRSFEVIVEEVAKELGTRNDNERVKAELERTRKTIQRLLEALG